MSTPSSQLELLGVGMASFLLMTAVVVLVSPLGSTEVTSQQRFKPSAAAVAEGSDALRVTLDCRDKKSAHYFDLDKGISAVASDAWDIGCKRHRILLPGGKELPKWYRYRMAAHHLEPLGKEYDVRTSEGGHVRVRPEAYYCEDGSAGCLTLRYSIVAPVLPPPTSSLTYP